MPPNLPEQSDKIDFVDMIVVLWKHRLKIVGTMFVTILVAAALLAANPAAKRGSIYFSALPEAAFLEATQILSVIGLNAHPTVEVDNNNIKMNYISSQLALSQFVSEFRAQRALRDAVKLHSSTYLQSDAPADAKEKLATQISQSFSISTKTDGTGLITFETRKRL